MPAVQGLQERVPVAGRHGQAQGRVPAQLLREPGRGRWATCSWARSSGSTRIGSASRAAGQRDAPRTRCSSGCWRRPPGSTAGGRCRRSSANHFRTWFDHHEVESAGQASGARSCCSTIASRPTTTPRSASRRSRCWKRPATGWTWPSLRCCGRPAISKGLLTLGRDLARENVEKLLPLRGRACRSSAASRAAW